MKRPRDGSVVHLNQVHVAAGEAMTVYGRGEPFGDTLLMEVVHAKQTNECFTFTKWLETANAVGDGKGRAGAEHILHAAQVGSKLTVHRRGHGSALRGSD